MNYFGFRKIAGKGKLAPCSYVNELATEDISSLLLIKRKKAGISSAAAKLMAQQHQITRSLGGLGGGIGTSGRSLGIVGNSMGVGFNREMSTAVSLNDPQMMFAQLQQAHLLSLTNSGIQQATQNKIQMNNGLNVGAPGGMTNGILTPDQGNVFMSSKTSNHHNINSVATNPLSLLTRHEATTSGFSSSERPSDNINLARLDSAANLRALLNQQISMYNTPGGGDPYSFQLPPTSGFAHGQATMSLANANASAAQRGDLLHRWNDILQLSAGMGTYNDAVDSTNRSLIQLEQQLLQGNNTGAESSYSDSTPYSLPFNMSGIFGLGAAYDGVQKGFQY